MIETGSDSEAILQELLARYLNLLAGDASGGLLVRRWLLVSREAPLKAQDGRKGPGLSTTCSSTMMLNCPSTTIGDTLCSFARRWEPSDPVSI